jgi:hypothetical protein
VQVERKADADDDRPPICPACGVTMGITIDEDGSTRYVCLECGFSDDRRRVPSCERPIFRQAGKRREFGRSGVVSWGAHPA